MYHVPLALQRVYGYSDEKAESGDGEEGRELRFPCLLYADDLVLCVDWEEDLKVMVGRFVEVCRRRGFKVNADKSKVRALGREEGLWGEIYEDESQLEQVSEFICLGYVLNESGTADAKCRRKVASRRKVTGAIISLVNSRGLLLECAKMLQEGLLVSVLLYVVETII